MEAHELLNVLKNAQKFLSKDTAANAFCRSVYFMTAEGKLEVRASNGYSAFSSSLEYEAPEPLDAPVIISIDALSQAIAALRGCSKHSAVHVISAPDGFTVSFPSGTAVSFQNIPEAENVRGQWRQIAERFFNSATAFDSTLPAAGCMVPANALAQAFLSCKALGNGAPLVYRCRQDEKSDIFWRVSLDGTQVVVMSMRDDPENPKRQPPAGVEED